jgi:hypothetical protein
VLPDFVIAGSDDNKEEVKKEDDDDLSLPEDSLAKIDDLDQSIGVVQRIASYQAEYGSSYNQHTQILRSMTQKNST